MKGKEGFFEKMKKFGRSFGFKRGVKKESKETIVKEEQTPTAPVETPPETLPKEDTELARLRAENAALKSEKEAMVSEFTDLMDTYEKEQEAESKKAAAKPIVVNPSQEEHSIISQYTTHKFSDKMRERLNKKR